MILVLTILLSAHKMIVCVCILTLLDIIMVSRDLLCELKATFSVEAWTMMRMACRTETNIH